MSNAWSLILERDGDTSTLPIEEGRAEVPFPHAKVSQLRRRGQDSQRARVVFGRHGRPVYSIQLRG